MTPTEAIASIRASWAAGLSPRLSDIEVLIAECGRVRALEAQLIAAERAIGDHCAPNDCYATGPSTGDPYTDLVECPACVFLGMRKEAITTQAPRNENG